MPKRHSDSMTLACLESVMRATCRCEGSERNDARGKGCGPSRGQEGSTPGGIRDRDWSE